ncbi:hypothetical protein [Streptomyces sp. NPDC048111]|uniref:hypothetical protein n=1 Tax=Streptomyces sp. NPDC048111 TaxID=3365500 RepID=UPI00371327C8
MTGDGWSAAVRRRLGAGRLLALGGPEDGAWITERAAGALLSVAAAGVPGLVLTSLRVGPADPDAPARPLVTPPPSALPPVPLRITAELAVVGGHPVPELTARLREALFSAAQDRLGLDVSDVDLKVTDLLDAPPGTRPDPPFGGPPPGPAEAPATAAAAAALATPGVVQLTDELGPPVRETDGHLQVELTTLGHPLEVARAVRGAVARAVPAAGSVGVLVTWVT